MNILQDVKKIRIGFQNRKDALSGKLAFLSFSKDGKNLVNKTVFNKWCDNSIKKEKFENNFIAGFVLSKANLHQLYQRTIGFVRVYHPNGFDFEIPLENVYYLMQYTLIDHGQIKNECKIFFDKENKPWILPEEALNIKELRIEKVKDVDEEIESNISNHQITVEDYIGANKKNWVVVNEKKCIYPFEKDYSMFDFHYYLLEMNYVSEVIKQKRVLLTDGEINYKTLLFKDTSNTKDMILLKDEEVSINERKNGSILTNFNDWNYISWNSGAEGALLGNLSIEDRNKSLERMFNMVNLTNFSDLKLNNVVSGYKSENKNLLLIMLSNFYINKNGENYRIVVTKSDHIKLLSNCEKNELSHNDYYVFAIHLGKNELMIKDKTENEDFDKVKWVPLMSIEKNQLNSRPSTVLEMFNSILQAQGFV